MRIWVLAVIVLAGCATPTKPTVIQQPAPTPPPVTTAPPPPDVVVPPPTPPPSDRVPLDHRFSLSYYQDFAQGQYEHGRIYGLQRLTAAPMIFLNTVDEAGRPIEAVTLDVVSAAFINVASTWAGGRFGLAGIERGRGTREGQRGWLTVRWDSRASTFCGTANHGVDGGVITFYYRGNCGCAGSAMRPSIAKHELGHAFGFWHTRNGEDVMTGEILRACDRSPSTNEVYHAQVAYGQPIGSLDPS